jgi:RHS repeat-associated protein
MGMMGRSVTAEGYRYGFNGQEKETEITGSPSHTSAEFWMYDSRLGRRWEMDPVKKEHESVYAAFANNPIFLIDPNGADTSLTDKSRPLILDLINPESKNYNEKFAKDFQRLVEDKTTIYLFDQWDKAKEEIGKDGVKHTTFGQFSGRGKNEEGQNLVTIGYSLESPSQGHKLEALFEEFDHAHQFLSQRIGFIDLGDGWQTISYDFYDEVDNKVGRVTYLAGFKEGSEYKVQLYGTNAKILKSNFSRSAAERVVRLNYGFTEETEQNVFEVFIDPIKMKEEFIKGVRWNNLLIGIGK